MSKRYIFPQQNGDRKKARLDITISDHNFPLSQNGPSKEPEQDNWGDDNDDEILLLASQACEDAYNDISSLPDYSICMQPGTTSTQKFDPGPSTSKTGFTFKKPSAVPSNVISTSLKDKCNRISSPLPGMSSKVLPRDNVDSNINLGLICNDKIYKSQDSDYIYKQLLQLQEENTKLKSENGKLLEKCVTKEGEASILRTQLKSSQIAVDNARLERIRAQEKVQMEWTEKLAAANGQMHDLRTQLDFKNLEIISIKEKCKMLESNKVKLTQVTVANDNNSSHRNNFSTSNDFSSPKRVKMISNSVQTEDKAHFLRLNKSFRMESSKLTSILPIILETTLEQHTLLEYNEKLQKHTDLSQNKCRIYSTFHRILSTPAYKEVRSKITLSSLYEDLTSVASGNGDANSFYNILTTTKSVLAEVSRQLELVSQKMTTAFQKEMDERYMDNTTTYLVVDERDVLGGSPLYKEEQSILARRMTSILSHILQNCREVLLTNYHELCTQLMGILLRICQLLDSTSCALLYSGLLLSITYLIDNFTNCDNKQVIETIRHMISSRPMTFISCKILKLLRRLSIDKDFVRTLCPGSGTGNLRLDYDQGVLLYKKDSCYLQVLLKQVETALHCIERQNLTAQASNTTTQLVALYTNINDCGSIVNQDKFNGCDCQLVLIQVIVYALRICAVMLKDIRTNKYKAEPPLLATLTVTCRGGVRVVYEWWTRDMELSSQLQHYAGYLHEFCDTMRRWEHSEIYLNMLSELSGTFQSSPDDTASCFNNQPWMNSFQTFSISD